MSSLAAVGIKSGFQIIRYFFCKNLDRGDYTNEQILSVFENKIVSIAKDLEDLKLQKLRSATFLFKSGVQMFHSHDIEEARRNFDKSEMDAIEAFSTAPSVDWKILSIKIAICAHIWRKAGLAHGCASTVNFESVMKQVLLHIHRLLEDDGIRNNVKTHVMGSIFSNINKSKRIELINAVLNVEESSRKVLFDNFLEILPSSYVSYDDDQKISLLSLTSDRHDLVPFSPRQCSLIEPIPAVKSWRNVSCVVSLERNATQQMVSCGTDHSDQDVYVAQRKWIDLYSTVKSLMASIQNFEINRKDILGHSSAEGDEDTSTNLIKMDDFEVVYICVKVSFKCPIETPPRVYLYLDDEPQPGASFHMAIKSRGGSDQIYSASFYRGDNLIKSINRKEGTSVLNVNLFAANCDVEARNFEVLVHYKSKLFSNALHLDSVNNLETKMAC